VKRWWPLLTAPGGFVVGMLLGRVGVPTWLIVIVVFVLTAGLAFYFRIRTKQFHADLQQIAVQGAEEILRREGER
jgi:ABC-type branched-subunit amino acid transport system permease subunit